MSPAIDAPDYSTPNAAQLVTLDHAAVPVAGAAIDVSAWASVVVKLSATDPSGLFAVKYVFSTVDGFVIDQGFLSANTSFLSGCAWQLPVAAAILTLSKTIVGSQQYAVFGSNMPVPGKRMLSDMLPLRTFTLNGIAGVPANSFTRMAGGPVDGTAVFDDLTGYNGDCDFTARVFTTGGVAQWDFLVEILNLDGTFTRAIYGSLTAVATLSFTKGHPRAWVRWLARNTTATTGAWSLELDVAPKALC